MNNLNYTKGNWKLGSLSAFGRHIDNFRGYILDANIIHDRIGAWKRFSESGSMGWDESW